MVLCQHDIHADSGQLEAAQGHGALWTDLIATGVLDMGLLPILWKEFEPASHRVLLQLMHRFGLICPIAPSVREQPPSRYLVPSLLPEATLTAPPPHAATCYISFSSESVSELMSDRDTLTAAALRALFLPEGLFPRVVARCVEWIQQTSLDKAPLGSMSLRRREALLSFGPHRCLLQHLPKANCFALHILVQNTEVVIQRMETVIASVIADAYHSLHSTILLPCSGSSGGGPDQGSDESLFVPLHAVRSAVETKKGLWLGSSLASPSQLSSRFAAFLPPKGLLPSYDIFISYRWTPKHGAFCTDSEFASKLFDVVGSYAIGTRGRRPEVFLDRNRLEEGRRFDQDFMTAMANSAVVVPLVSFDALQRMLTVQPGLQRPCDNVVLEWCLVTELQEQGRVECVLPVIIGKIEAGIVSNIFDDDVMGRLPEVPCEPEIAKVREFLTKNGWRESRKLATLTIKSVVDSICNCLGIMLWDLQASHGSVRLGSALFGLHEEAAARIMQKVEQQECRGQRGGEAEGVVAGQKKRRVGVDEPSGELFARQDAVYGVEKGSGQLLTAAAQVQGGGDDAGSVSSVQVPAGGDGLGEEIRRLRREADDQKTSHEAEMERLSAQLEAKEREQEERLSRKSEQQ